MSDENVGGLVELLPCPFCGSQPKLETHRKYHSYSARDAQRDGMGVSAGGFITTSWSVDCACGISIHGNNDAFLVQRWNTRVSAHGQPVVDAREAAAELADYIKALNPDCCNASFPAAAAKRCMETITAALKGADHEP